MKETFGFTQVGYDKFTQLKSISSVRVLMVMGINCNEDNEVQMTQTQLAKKLKMSRLTVINAVKELTEEEFVIVEKNGKFNKYTINFDYCG